MSRVLPIAIVVWVAFTVFTLVDVALIDRRRIRGLPKLVWILVILLVPLVGGTLWLVVGRVRSGDVAGSVRRGPVAPDDDPDFLRKLNRERAMEERIEQLERELRDLDDDKPQS